MSEHDQSQTEHTVNSSIPTSVRWYRTALSPHTLADLNAKSDARGFLQSLGYLGILVLTASVSFHAAGRWPWWTVVLMVFLHGTVASFAINAVHELVHKSVFETQWLNALFVRIFSLISWVNFEHFYRSCDICLRGGIFREKIQVSRATWEWRTQYKAPTLFSERRGS